MIGIASKFIVAQIAVSVSGIAAYPFDTMQRRLQIEATKPKSEQIYNGMADCFGKILKAEGPGGFFKGALANILRGTGAAIVLVLVLSFSCSVFDTLVCCDCCLSHGPLSLRTRGYSCVSSSHARFFSSNFYLLNSLM